MSLKKKTKEVVKVPRYQIIVFNRWYQWIDIELSYSKWRQDMLPKKNNKDKVIALHYIIYLEKRDLWPKPFNYY